MSIDHARQLVANANPIVVLTGAGVSHESGVPTFRGPEGLWRDFRPEELATPEAFLRDPRLVWEWYGWRRELVARCAPNAAHLALAVMAAARDGVLIVTQNVDGLHGAAAADAGERAIPLELHGSLFRVRCTMCAYRASHREKIDASSDATLPRCPKCGALLRPDVVWFGEPLDDAVIGRAWDAAGRAELCLVIGTSGVVQPAASLAGVTRHAGGEVIEVNLERTALSALASITLLGTAADIIPRITGDVGVGDIGVRPLQGVRPDQGVRPPNRRGTP